MLRLGFPWLGWVLLVGLVGCGQPFSAESADASADGKHAGSGGSSGTSSSGSGSSSSGGSSGASSSSGSGSGGSSSSGSSSGGVAEGGSTDGSSSGATCTTPSGGAPSTPGYVDCRGKLCDVSKEVCCIQTQGIDAATIATCVQLGVACPGVTLACDQQADCPGGEVCCVDLTTNTQTCASQCPSGSGQVCRCEQECSAGSPCTVCPAHERCTSSCG